ncbi:hypothetical protein [Profundibacter sp.]|uniref:hypothetical protein n=1 Tax=Profundibacter sp. TaxID=3101071 RepID=UPI003D14660B
MKTARKLIIGILKLVAALLLLVVVLGFASLISHKALMITGGIIAASAFAVIFSKDAAATKTNKAIASVVFVLAALMAFGGYVEGQKEQKRIAALRATDPAAYLLEIEESDPDLWLAELEQLDPEAYQAEMARRAQEAAEAAARQREQEERERRAEAARQEAERRAAEAKREADRRAAEAAAALERAQALAPRRITGAYVGCMTKAALDEFVTAASNNDLRQIQALTSTTCTSIEGLEYSIVDRGWMTSQIRVYGNGTSAVLWTVSEALKSGQ